MAEGERGREKRRERRRGREGGRVTLYVGGMKGVEGGREGEGDRAREEGIHKIHVVHGNMRTCSGSQHLTAPLPHQTL